IRPLTLIVAAALRGWMITDGLWQDRRHRLPSPHQPRRRRDCLRELVQIDGPEHAWLEDRGPPCTLLAFVDDATSRLTLPGFITAYNTRFGRDPANAKRCYGASDEDKA